MSRLALRVGSVLAAAAIAGCVSMPSGPNVRVMPAPFKPFEVFRVEDDQCRDFAADRAGRSAEQAQGDSAGRAVTGAAVGAAVGGLITQSGEGAAAGAGFGLLGGALSGATAADWSSWSLQRRYDWSYSQCMYAKGNQVPGFGPVSVPPPPPPPPPKQPPKTR